MDVEVYAPKNSPFRDQPRERFKEFSDAPAAALGMAILLLQENDAVSDRLWGN